MNAPQALAVEDFDSASLHQGLVAHGLIVPTGVKGVFGRGPVFEDVLARFDAAVQRLAADEKPEQLAFPPVLDRKVFEKVGYLESFPHLCGSIHSFYGDAKSALRVALRAREGDDWGQELRQTDVVLTPAACYPLYPSLAGTLPEQGRVVSMLNWVFRNEPSDEPTRMQSFRVREMVKAGTTDQVVAWRDRWLEQGLSLLRGLQLPAESDVASDPFFGRAGQMLARSQLAQKLKFEVQVPVISRENPTALCSFNFHQEHFGEKFDIRTADGAVANTACLGFGLERVVMALFRHHGFDPAQWPAPVRAKLWG